MASPIAQARRLCGGGYLLFSMTEKRHFGRQYFLTIVHPQRRSCRRFLSSTPVNSKEALAAQKKAYEFYASRRRKERQWWPWSSITAASTSVRRPIVLSTAQRNANTAWYALALAVGALGASYAAVPLYKVFCQTTGFGGTTQRVLPASQQQQQSNGAFLEATIQRMLTAASLGKWLPASSSSSARVHTWTDDEAIERLRRLRPVTNADLITVRFDTTVTDVMPWSFVPVQLDVKVVPGETALSFFRVTNHSDKAITGVATYNVHPPKVGLYFAKIQCFCFEEQRLLPGETVDMPVFFFIDPDILDDPQVSYVKSVTLSYTFFQTDEDDDDDEDRDDVKLQKNVA